MDASITVQLTDLSDGTDLFAVTTSVEHYLRDRLPDTTSIVVDADAGEPLWVVNVELKVGGQDQLLAEEHVEKLLQDANLAHLIVVGGITATPANATARMAVSTANECRPWDDIPWTEA